MDDNSEIYLYEWEDSGYMDAPDLVPLIHQLLAKEDTIKRILQDAEKKEEYRKKLIEANEELIEYKTKEWESKSYTTHCWECHTKYCDKCKYWIDGGCRMVYRGFEIRHDIMKPILVDGGERIDEIPCNMFWLNIWRDEKNEQDNNAV